MNTAMNKTVLTVLLALAGTSVTGPALADHRAALREEYQLYRAQLEYDYKQLRRSNRDAFHQDRDALRKHRSYVLRIDCRDTRIAELRAVNRQLAELSREFSASNREMVAWYHAQREALRDAYEAAKRSGRGTVADSIVLGPPLANHPDGCGCSTCHPQRSIRAGWRANPILVDEHGDRRHDHRVVHRRQPTAIDVAALILSLFD